MEQNTLIGNSNGTTVVSRRSFVVKEKLSANGQRPTTNGRSTNRGFTLLEMIIVLTIIAILVSVAIPAYQIVILRAKESVLKENLHLLRRQLEEYAADRGTYPQSLQELVDKGYLRQIPLDAITGARDTWVAVPEDQSSTQTSTQSSTAEGQQPGIKDVKSGAQGKSSDGTLYSDW